MLWAPCKTGKVAHGAFDWRAKLELVMTLGLGVMVFVALSQLAVGAIYLVFGENAADKRKGAKRLAMGGAVILLLVLLAGLPACAPIPPAGSDAVSTVEPATVRSVPLPSWSWPVDQWLNMDWDLWSCPRARGC